MIRVSAVVPVRGGSKRVPNKNIRNFYEGLSLLELKLNQLTYLDWIDDIFVSSEDQRMLDLAASCGVTPLPRDPAFAQDDTPVNDLFHHIATQLPCEHVMYTNCTNPLVPDEDYYMAWDMYRDGYTAFELDSVVSATEVNEFLWMNSGPVNYDPDKMPRSQDLPATWKLNCAFSILPRQLMLEKRRIIGDNPRFYPLTEIEGWDIDTMTDFEIAQWLYERSQHGESPRLPHP